MMYIHARRLAAAAAGATLALASTTAWAQHDTGPGVSGDQQTYQDVPEDHAHHDGIAAVTDAGVASGYPDGSFRPDEELSRGQLATLLATAAHLETDQDPPFEDVSPDHAHAHGIAAAAEWELVRGYPDGTYRPQLAVSRAQIATMVARAYNLEAEGPPQFDDVPADHAHAEGIAALAENGIAEGDDDGTYRPDTAVTRGQMASLLSEADPQL